MKRRSLRSARQEGVTLIIVLVLLIASVFLGVSAAVIALQTEKASRGDRDRQIAFQAAEAALIDAQMDIDTASLPGHRPLSMSPDSTLGFPPSDQATICYGKDDPGYGLCKPPLDPTANRWPAINLSDAALTVPYGRFTGQQFPVGQPGLPAAVPRYVIELVRYAQLGIQTNPPTFAYRITAIGFGASTDTQVVLQAFYRKISP